MPSIQNLSKIQTKLEETPNKKKNNLDRLWEKIHQPQVIESVCR